MGIYISWEGGEITDKTTGDKKFAAFLFVTLFAALVPFAGLAAAAALIPALAACVGALRTPAKYLYFIPGGAICVALFFVLNISPEVYGAILSTGVIGGFALGVAIRKKASATAQTVTLTVTMCLCFLAMVAAYAFTVFGSIGDFVKAAYDYAVARFAPFADALDSAVDKYASADPQSAQMLKVYSLSALDPKEVVRSAMLSLPGLIGFAAFTAGWAMQLLSRVFLKILGRGDLITEKRRIAIPASLAVIFLILRLTTYFMSGESLFSVCAVNVANALFPAMLIVGGGFVFGTIRSTRSRFSVMFIIMFSLSALIMPAVFLSALTVAGVIGTVVRAVRERRQKKE